MSMRPHFSYLIRLAAYYSEWRRWRSEEKIARSKKSASFPSNR
jgi:hypothetical protein